jgi:hypothetical protein
MIHNKHPKRGGWKDEFGIVTNRRSLRASRRAARLAANIALFERTAYDKPVSSEAIT